MLLNFGFKTLSRNFCFVAKLELQRKMSSQASLENLAVEKLVQYLRIKTAHPNPDYGNYTKTFDRQIEAFIKKYF
jgi:hypothetical protein